MRVIIAGAGEVGQHVAAVLAAGNHQITVIDLRADRLESVAENLDVGTLVGAATRADVLLEAGVEKASLFVAAAHEDEINLLAASLAKGLGCRQVIARVHHSAYHSGLGIDYAAHLGIDQLVCPEFLTSLAIAGMVRDPAVQAIEYFARGQLVMERVEISDQAAVLGRPLKTLNLPAGFRIGTLRQNGRTVVPTGDTILSAGDEVALIGTTGVLEKTLPMFRKGTLRPRRVVIMGGSPISVWLTRALRSGSFKVRLYVLDPARAEELADKLPYATVVEADPTDPDIFAEDNVAEADPFIAATGEDEHNILGALQAKHLGVRRTLAVINRSTYHQLIEGIGIDGVFSPRIAAAREIQRLAQQEAIQQLALLDEEGTAVYGIRVGGSASAVGKTVVALNLPLGCVLLAIQRGNDVTVPGPADQVKGGDRIVAIAQEGLKRQLHQLFA